MLRFLGRLKRDESAAVAATVALSLFGLIAVGGIAFDYARMATLDSELQNAADQAALAGVTQLDGSEDAITNAITAAQTLVTNRTLLSNDSVVGTAIEIPDESIAFFTDTGAPTTDPAVAARINVSVTPRSVFYALTPIVGALQSGPMTASALAGLQTSICNVPPLYMAFDADNDDDLARLLIPGTGILLLGAESASHFGYLDTGSSKIKEAMAWDDQEGRCQGNGSVEVRTGVVAAIKKGFNTRFANGNGNGSCPQGGTCSTAADTTTFVRDSCHATGNTPKTPVSPCTSVIGNGAYAGKAGTQTRYEKYKQLVGSGYDFGSDRRRLTIAVLPYGSFGPGGSPPEVPVVPTKWLDVFITEPISGNGNSGGGGGGGPGKGKDEDPVDPDDASKDGLHFYVEVIGESNPAISGRRDVPYLLN